MGTLFSSLVAGGLGNLASSIFDGFMNKGEESIKELIKDKLGIDVELNKPLSESELAKFKHKEELIRLSLDELKERNRHEETTLQQELSYAELDVEDVKSARLANIEYGKSDSWLTANFLPVFSIFLLTLVGWSMGYILTTPPGDMDKTTALVIMEFNKAVALLVIGFWFGSSHGSKAKTRYMEDKEYREQKSKKEQQELGDILNFDSLSFSKF